MPPKESHFSDQELLMALDGELSPRDCERVKSHTATCWKCRTRQREIEGAIGAFIEYHRENSGAQIPPADGPRALLKARLAQAVESHTPLPQRLTIWRVPWPILGAACALAAMMYFLWPLRTGRTAQQTVTVTTPDPNLTPGAMTLADRDNVCVDSYPNNKVVPVALQRKVFDEYGIHSALPGAYEVDYLITPALGGTDDIRNLWPQSKAAGVWNAKVKDALENHLRVLVCDGQVDLATAQREMATNWIGAYKKYFHSDQPLTRFR